MRQALAALAAVLILAVAVTTALRALDDGDSGGDTAEAAAAAPEATVDAYLAAWQAGDHDAMAELVRDPPEGFRSDHQQLRDGLGVEALTLERTAIEEDVDGRANATAAVTAELPVVGELTWEVTVQVLRERGAWGVAWTPETMHPTWRPGLRFTTTTVAAERAPILAIDGTPLAGPGQRVTFGLEPGVIGSADEVVEAFEQAIPDSGSTVSRLLDRDDLVDGWFYPVVSLSAEEAVEPGRQLSGIAGVLRRTDDEARSLLADGFAAHIVGRTGEATAEELEELGAPYEPGDVIGRAGLEAALEPQLAEREELHVELRDGADGPVRATLATAAVDGGTGAGPVTTTLDVTVQRAIENALVGRGSAAAVVVVDGDDGAIRGSASRPLDAFDRALEGRYAPGTAFAPVLVEALLAERHDPVSPIGCPAEAVVVGRRIENVAGGEGDHSSVPEALAAGCATAAAELGAELGGDALSAAAERFGAGRDPDLPLFSNGLSFPDPIDVGEAAVAASGQGRVEVSPLHVATIAVAASTGRWWPPYLLDADGSGEPTTLTPGALDGLQRLLAAEGDGGPDGFAAAAHGAGDDAHGWFVGSVEGLGFAVLVEGDPSEVADDASELAARFVRELQVSAETPVDSQG